MSSKKSDEQRFRICIPIELMEKQRFTIHLPMPIMEKAKDIAYWTPGLTLSKFVADAILSEIARIESIHGPYRSRGEGKLGGRPIGS